MKRKVLWICLLLMVVPVCAQFLPPGIPGLGLGMPVVDVTQILQTIKSVEQQIAIHGLNVQQLAQLVSLLNMVTNQYNHMLVMAHQLSGLPASYRALWSRWQVLAALDTFSRNAAYIANANGAQGQYPRAVVPLPGISAAALAELHPNTADRLRWQYAAAELADGVNQHALNAVGSIRYTGPSTEQALQNLDARVHSSDPADNTYASLQKQNAVAASIQARQMQDTNKLLVSLAEQQALAAKVRRDEFAQAVAQWQELRSLAPARQAFLSGYVEAVDGFRW